MQKFILILNCIFLTATALKAQPRNSGNRSFSCPKLYIGVSTGLENPGGLLGFNVDVPVTQQFSLGTGVGLSSWGYKTYGEGRFYFGECNRGWALGTGITYNTGIRNFNTVLPTKLYGEQDVPLDLEPKLNVFLAAYRFWSLGRSGHRMYLALGYSLRTDNNNYTILNPVYELTTEGKQVMQILAPGGFMIGFGFSFGVVK